MIISRCCKCGAEQSAEEYGRQAMVTVEKYTESGMSVERFVLCAEHERILSSWLKSVEEELAETARCCGND